MGGVRGERDALLLVWEMVVGYESYHESTYLVLFLHPRFLSPNST